MKLSHCGRCGGKIEGKKYNPYNVTFNEFFAEDNQQKLCKKCADIFITNRNKCKGGHWVLDEPSECVKKSQ